MINRHAVKTSIFAASIVLSSFFFLVGHADAATPTVTSVNSQIGTFAGLINTFTTTIVKALGTLFMASAMVAFFWGIVQYIWGAREGDAKQIAVGNTFIKWSLVALFVMFSVYGIVKFAQSFLCGDNGCDNTITIPDINFKTGERSPSGTPGVPGAGLPTGTSGVPGARLPTGSPGIPNTGYAPTDLNQTANGCSGSNIGSRCTPSSGGAGVCGASDFGYECISSGSGNPGTPPADLNQTSNGCSSSNVGSSCVTSSGKAGSCAANDFGYACD